MRLITIAHSFKEGFLNIARHPLVTLASATTVALMLTLIGFFFMTLTIRASRKYFVAQQRDLGDMNGHVEEIYAGHNIVRAYNGEKGARKTFDKINDRLKTSAFKS